MPKAERGTQGTGTGMNGHAFPMFSGPTDLLTSDNRVNKTVKDDPNPNVEAEKGETLWDDRDKDGIAEHYKIKGSKHSQGGTGIDMGKSGFIFSDTKSMKITDEDILKMFGKTSKKGLTPAKIAEQYDINEYLKILKDPNSDKIQRETAEKMINNYNLKLGQLALVQESKKGFDQGVPDIAMPYLESMGMNPQMFDMFPQVEAAPVMKTGGTLPKYAPGGGDPTRVDKKGQIIPEKALTKQGSIAPTGKNSNSPFDEAEYRNRLINMGVDVDNLYPLEMQQQLYDKADPFVKAYMWGNYGITNKGKAKVKDPKMAQYAAKENESFADYKTRMSEQYSPEMLNEEMSYYKDSFADRRTGARALFLAHQPDETVPVEEEKQQEFPVGDGTPPDIKTYKPKVEHLGDSFIPGKPNDEYWLQDRIRQFGNTRDYLTTKKYLPWQATPDVAMVQGTFYDPNREIAANAEMAQMMEQNLVTFQGPQVASARAGEIQGNAAKTIADTMGRYNNLNVGVANQLDQMNASIYNTASAQRAGLATQMFDKNTIANQQFDNTRNQILHNMDDTQINAETNRAYTSNMNALYPQYNIHPELGGNMSYTGVPGQVTPHYTDPAALLKKYTELKKAGITDEAIIRFLMGQKTAPVNDDPRAAYMASMGYPG